jgi:hypothetical protein
MFVYTPFVSEGKITRDVAVPLGGEEDWPIIVSLGRWSNAAVAT